MGELGNGKFSAVSGSRASLQFFSLGVVCPDKAVLSLETALPSYQDVGHSGFGDVSEGERAGVSTQGLVRVWKSWFKVNPNREHVGSSFRRGLGISFADSHSSDGTQFKTVRGDQT